MPIDRKILTVAALGSAQTLSWGSSYYLPAILAAPMAVDLGVGTTTVYAAVSGAMLVSAAFGPVSGRAIDRWGGRPVLLATNVVFAAGLAALALARGPVSLFAAWIVIGIAMGSGLYEAAFAALVRLYGRDSRDAITGITLIAGFASTVGWPLSTLMLGEFGWRGACWGWALAHLAAGLPLNASIPRAPPQASQVADPTGSSSAGSPAAGDTAEESPVVAKSSAASTSAASTSAASTSAAPTSAASTSAASTSAASTSAASTSGEAARRPPDENGRRRSLALIAFAFATTWFISTAMAAHLPRLLQLGGASLASAVAVGALVGPAQVAARIAEYGLLRRFHPLRSARAASLGHPLGALVFLVAGAPAAWAFGLLHGAGNGLMTIAKGTLPLALFGPHGYGARQGVLMIPARIAPAFAPFVFGALMDRWGADVLWLSAAIALTGTLALALVRPPAATGP
ncbi:MAG: MFS transporter [Burkholderiaceae bacterium]